MIFSNSPVKNLVERLNPSSEKNKISRLKFERKSDYRTFLKFIKNNTKEIEDTGLPGVSKKTGLLAAGGLGLGLLAFGGLGGSGRGDSKDGKDGINNLDDVYRKAQLDNKKISRGIGKTSKDVTGGKNIIQLESKRRVITNRRKVRSFKKGSKTFSRQFGRKRVLTPEIKVNPLANRKITKSYVRVPVTVAGGGSSADEKIGTPSTEDIKNQKNIEKKYERKLTKPKRGEIAKQQRILRNFNKSQITEPTRINDKNFKNLKNLISGNFSSDDLDNVIKEQRGYDSEGRKIVPKTDKNEISKRLSASTTKGDQARSQYGMDGGYGDSNVGDMTQNKSTQNKKFKFSKFFEAPEIPKSKTSKLSNLDKFNRFQNRILNTPAAKFTTFAGGLLANPKFEIIKQLFTATPLADGTLEGKPGVYNSENFMLDEETSVNIFNFSEERESMIPFDTAVNASIPSVTTPSDLQSSKKSIFIDYEFNSTEDMFFIKMAGS